MATPTVLYLERTIDASHVIPDHPGKCARLHGHTYRFQIWLAGSTQDDGMVIDFFEVKRIVDAWDHRHLNDVVDFVPTAELLAAEVHRQIAALLAERAGVGDPSACVRLWETPSSYAQVGDGALTR